MKIGTRILVGYLALLLASFAYQTFSEKSSDPSAAVHRIFSPQPTAPGNASPPPAPAPAPTTVVMLHGFFGVTDEMIQLAETFRQEGRTVYLPDLYSFSHDKGDYSLVDRMPGLESYLQQAGVNSAHLITFGLGGPAAVHFCNAYPDRVQSLTLLSASGTQKFELLGDYSLNKALYSLLSVFYWSLNHLLPDFGLIHQLPFEQENLRSLADIDLRPVEQQMQKIQLPTLIIHGLDDYLVPVQAARQHHALLTESELSVLDMSHALTDAVFPEVYSKINTFMTQVDSASFVPPGNDGSFQNDPVLTGHRFWFITGLVFIGTKFSEDLATVAAGLLVSRDILPFWVAVTVCFFGIVAGDTAIYFFGRFAGIGILRKRPLRWIISEQQVLDSEQWFENRGLAVIVLSRFVPATRLPVYMATGILGVPPLKFICVLCVAALIWTPLIVGLAAALGAPLLDLMEKYERWSLVILVGFFLTLTVLIKLFLPLATRRGRKLFFVRWHRLWRPSRNKRNP